MKVVTNASDFVEYIFKKYYRRLNSTKKIIAMIVFVLILGYIFLFLVNEEVVGKIGTLASVTIAGLVSWMQYDANRKNVLQERQQTATEICNFLVGNLKKHAKTDQLGNIGLSFFGKNSIVKKLPDGDSYVVEWRFSYIRVDEVADFSIVISRLSESESPSIVDSPVSLQLRDIRGIQQLGVYIYKAASNEESDRSRVSVKSNYISDGDWDMLMYSIGNIMRESRWKANPDLLDLNM